jgi:hypothetical protein
LHPSEIAGSGGVPTEVKQEGESPPPQAGGKGRYSPTANLERVTAKALKRGVRGPPPLVSEALWTDLALRMFLRYDYRIMKVNDEVLALWYKPRL